MEPQDEKGQALQFIRFEEETGSKFKNLPNQLEFYVDREAKAVLENILRPIGVFPIMGKYRPGNSYILKQLMGLPPDLHVFGVGQEADGLTKGLSLWS